MLPDGHIVYRASSLGSCTKSLVSLRLGYESAPVPAKMQKVFDAGHEAEEQVFYKQGLAQRICYDFQREVKVDVSSTISVVGHIDAIEQDDHLIEVKSQNQTEWDRFNEEGWESGFFPKYKWQVSVYMHALGLPLRLLRYNRATGQIQESVLEAPWFTLPEIRGRVLSIESQAAAGVLPAACDSLSFPCPVFYLHEDLDEDEIEDTQVDILASQYKNAKVVEKIAKEKADETRRALRIKGKKVSTAQTKVTFFDQSRLVNPVKQPTDEFSLEVAWENVKVTIKRTKD